MIKKWIKKLFGIREIEEEDFTKRGFTKMSKQGTVKKFYKDEFTLQWNYYRETVTIRLGKALRFFGVVETPKELKWVLGKIFM